MAEDPAAQQAWADAQAQSAFHRARACEASGDPASAWAWYERAHRLAPESIVVAFPLAMARLRGGDGAGAAQVLRALTGRFDFREGWIAQAAALLMAGEDAAAIAAGQQALSRHAPSEGMEPFCARLAMLAGRPGWCGLSASGRLHLGAGVPAVTVLVDGRPVPGAMDGTLLPARWRRAGRVEVLAGGAALLGSPLEPAALQRIDGLVTAGSEGLSGWAWHPSDPDHAPVLHIRDAERRPIRRVIAADAAPEADSLLPLARPRRFAVAAADLPPGLLHVEGPDGRDLPGSPLAVHPAASPGGPVRPPPPVPPRRAGPAIVIPVHGDRAATLACLESVRASVGDGVTVIVVDDATPDPVLAAELDRRAHAGSIRLIRHPRCLGFPHAANAGLRAAAGQDVVLLNSDTLVAGGWLEELADIAYGAADIGTVTPLSNRADLFSWPGADALPGDPPAPMPDLETVDRLMAAARAANRGQAVEVPTGHGFCLFLRHDCLAAAGPFRADLFAQGYGEENEFCRRAAGAGWRHVAAPGAFVGHAGGASFGAAGPALLRRNLAILDRLHPGYGGLVAAHLVADPLFVARRRLDLVCWRRGGAGWRRAVLLVTHDQGGGVERVVRDRARMWRAQGLRPVVLRPTPDGCRLEDAAAGAGAAMPRFRLPADRDLLLTVLRASGVGRMEWHHGLGHTLDAPTLAAGLGVPYAVHVHDYAWFCPRVALVDPSGRHCGMPGPAGCAACLRTGDSLLTGTGPVPVRLAAYRARAGTVLRGAASVTAPSADTARRMEQAFPGLAIGVVPPLDDEAPPPARARAPGARIRVAVPGAIGVEKGYRVLLAAAQDAAARALALEFVVVGHTPDDDALMATGRVFVTGPYAEADGAALLAAQRADLAFLPSIWPETWCFALGLAWQAGLRAVVFDLGAPAERVRRTGRGTVLPPELSIHELNTFLLSYGRIGAAGTGRREKREIATLHPVDRLPAPHAIRSPARRRKAR
ncbi:glycosyltransferase [Gluconacetobacter takamatsuzukensis]|uniref:Glycosyltransferase n=1 Tax=Gluconacetobacter takamatsuzukensis TaxID=1286190 RepID=A0A7W4KBN0_9PROT|nr:glycosyltransferase [Gluconacetobacter takamatsuzukensis]MBB2203943.1 glycosyltransferase [Gluconacetobacter takamatsuzukensis]